MPPCGINLSPSGDIVQERESKQGDETGTGRRRDIDSERHCGKRALAAASVHADRRLSTNPTRGLSVKSWC